MFGAKMGVSARRKPAICVPMRWEGGTETKSMAKRRGKRQDWRGPGDKRLKVQVAATDEVATVNEFVTVDQTDAIKKVATVDEFLLLFLLFCVVFSLWSDEL